jgi:excisionase family DNA binding protein
MPLEIKKPDELLTVQEAAKILKVIPRRVRQFIQEGRLPANKIGRPWFIKRTDLEAFKRVKRPTGNLTGKSRLIGKKKKK